MLKKLFSHTAIYGLAPQIPKIAGVLALPIITKFLTDIDFGIYGVITAVVGSVSVLGSLGLNLILSNAFFHSPGHYKWGWRQIYGFLILWNIPYAVLISGLLYFFIPDEAIKNAIWIIMLNVLPIVFFGPTSILGTYYYQLNQLPMQIGIRSAIFGTISVGLNILFIAGMKMGYMGWFLSACIATMLSQLSYWWPLNRKLGMTPIFNFKWRYIKNSLKVSLPIVPHYYSGYLLDSSDQMVMKLMNVGTGNIGLYNVANRIAMLVKQLGIAAGQAVGPMMYAGYKNNDQETPRRLVFSLQIVFLCMTFVLSIWLKEAFHILIQNESLAKIYPLGIIMVMAYNYRPMYYGANNRLFYNEKTKVLLKITFAAGVLNVILNVILIKLIGFEAAAYTTFACLMYMGYAGYYLKEFKEVNDLSYYPMFWLGLTIGLTIAAYYAVEANLWQKTILTVLTIIIGFLGFKKISS
jgi:O-antigen/teichoic acid export membrane protein